MRERRRTTASTAALRPGIAPDWQPRTRWELLAGLLRRGSLYALPLLLCAPFWAMHDLAAITLSKVLRFDGRRRVDVNWRHPAAPFVVPVLWLTAFLFRIFVVPFFRGPGLVRPQARKREMIHGRQ
ncbi:MAG: hypothetical protein JNM89_08035 [Hyphomicrobiaceae bacterium]|nr:hypothetical protein [Hyphomicrobiaceae bacterium]